MPLFLLGCGFLLFFGFGPSAAFAQSYDDWLDLHSLPADGSGLGAPDASPAVDGIANYVKFALGLEPFVPGYSEHFSAVIDRSAEPPEVTIAWRAPDPPPLGVVARVERSGDLSDWTPAGTVVTDDAIEGGFRYRRVTNAVSDEAGVATRGFFRLSVSDTEGPIHRIAPQIDGSLVVGATLTVDTGSWIPDSGLSFTYQWRKEGQAIDGASASTYRIDSADLNARISVDVTAASAEGSTTVRSVALGPVVLPVGEILADGWTFVAAEELSGDFDPYENPETLMVSRSGFDQSGEPVDFSEPVTKMKRKRLVVPDQDTLSARDVSLSWPVYAGERIEGVINRSERAVPAPLAVWMIPDREHIVAESGFTSTCKLFVAHAEGRFGTPVAAVRFILSDGVNSVEQLVTTLTPELMPVTGHSVPIYAADLDVSSLAEGPLVRDVIIYPHAGRAFQVSVDGEGYPSANGFSIQRALLNKGGYDRHFVYVDAENGDDATGLVYTSESAALAGTPFLNAHKALQAAQAANGGTVSRVVALLRAGQTHVLSPDLYKLKIDGADAASVPVRFKAAGPDTVVIDNGDGGTGYISRMTAFEGLTIRRTGNSSSFISNRANNEDNPAESLVILENCVLDPSGDLTTNRFIAHPGRLFLFHTESLFSVPQVLFDASRAQFVTGVGSSNLGGRSVHHAVGCDLSYRLDYRKGSNPATDHVAAVWAFNRMDNSGGGVNNVFPDGWNVDERGMAVVGNIGEIQGKTSDDNIELGTVNDAEILNSLFVQNSWPGGNSGMGYNQVGSEPVRKETYAIGNIFTILTVKGDTSNTPDGGRTGADFNRYKVGWYGNVVQLGGTVHRPGPDSSNGEILGLGEWIADTDTTGAPGYFKNATATGTNDLVGGDYRVTVNRENLPRLPARFVHYSHDLQGTPMPLDGTAVSGAVQAP